ncbi:adaptor protein MecA [Weissella diestrammenae]|uniref:Adapter protein MecA n=1 Tax=Weissella diestrammenae TaxID=1162633 RepID=A0A7G9T4S7_9LACO|nr:adaptor protein MecA [Weissella diestrammenae]MCM0582814.1 adaptor protein MecA [Weissella diestrammenae]QNN75102.1 adaptor protein MecA [Weissella diestrammenae]
MEMERINEDTIRVLVTNDDLTERSISIVELLGNQEAIEKFFYSILEEVDIDHDFEQNDAVTFQVLPNRNGLEMFISKNISEDQIPTNLINNILGDQTDKEVNDDVSEELLSQLLDSDTSRRTKKPIGNDKTQNDKIVSEAAGKQSVIPNEIIFKFDDFEGLILLAQALNIAAASRLISYENSYYLEFIFDDTYDIDEIKNITAIVREFGKLTPVAAEVLAEHGQVIFDANALDQILSYFK